MILFNITVLKINPSIYLLLYSAAIFIYIKKFECVRFRNWLKKTNLITNYKYNKILTGCKYNEYFFLTGRFKEVERIFKIIYTEVMHFRYLTYVLFIREQAWKTKAIWRSTEIWNAFCLVYSLAHLCQYQC